MVNERSGWQALGRRVVQLSVRRYHPPSQTRACRPSRSKAALVKTVFSWQDDR